MHRPAARSRFFLTAGVALTLAACRLAQDKDAAAAYAERYFAAAAAGDVAAVLPLYAPRFFTETPRDDWVERLQQVRERCGMPSAHDLRGWRITHNMGINPGTTARLVYEVRYQRCRMTETLVIFRSPGGDYGIVGHSFQMNGSAPAGSKKTTTT